AELRCRLVAVAGATGTLFGGRLLGRRREFGAALGFVRALRATRQLPHDAALQDVLAERGAEHRIGEVDLAGAAALDGFDRDFHDLILKPAERHRPPHWSSGSRLGPSPRQRPCAGRPGTERSWGGRAWRRP